MSRFLLYFVSLVLLFVLGYLVYYALFPKPIVSEKVSSGQDLQFVKAYPESSNEKGKFYRGKLYKSGKINVVVMEGTYEEMGRQYGSLLKDELVANYNGIVAALNESKDLTAKDIQEESDTLYNTYPEKYQKIIKGLAETSGLGIEKAKFLLSQESYVMHELFAKANGASVSGISHCSVLALWGDYTTDGKMLVGRNYDLGSANHQYVNVAVYNPIDGSIPSASVTYTGGIYVTTGINRDNLYLELNSGSISDKNDYMGERTMTMATLFNFLEQSKDNNALSIMFNTTLPDSSYIITAADKNSAYSYEWSTYGVKKREPDKKNIISATNMFFYPSWGESKYDVVKDSDFVVKRKDNLIALGDKYKGQISPEKMMEIMALPLEDGGSFRVPDLTSYEIVAEPETLNIWIRVPEYQDWTKVNLAQLFNKN